MISIFIIFFDPKLALQSMNYLVTTLYLFILYTGIISFRKGNKIAPYFLAAQLLYLLCSILFSLSAAGLLEYKLIYQHLITVGSAIEMILFSTALAYQLRLLGEQNIQLHKENFEIISAREKELDTIIENLPLMVFLKDAKELRFVKFNRAGEELTGLSKAKILGKNDYNLFPKEQADFFTQHDRQVIASKHLIEIVQEPIDTPHGKRLLHTRKVIISDEENQPIYLLGISEDITDKKKLENELVQSEESFRSLFESLDEALYVQDAKGTILAVNHGACRMYGHSKEWFVGKTPFDFSMASHNDHQTLNDIHAKAMAGTPQQFEFWGVHADGMPFPTEIHQTKGVWHGKEVVFTVATNISQRKQYQKKLEQIAHYDALTALPNRLLLSDRMTQALARSKRNGKIVAVIYLDLDGFKTVNDLYGHDVGDQLLIAISKGLQEELREGGYPFTAWWR